MKIGIITFHSAHNYGAVLQAWSLQEYLKQQGHTVEIVNFRLDVIDKLYRLTRKTHRKVTKKKAIDDKINKLYYDVRLLGHRFKEPQKYEKYVKFERFINHVLPVTKEVNNYQQLCQLNLHYDAMIVGSDQVWNGTMMKGINPAYFLQFGNKNALRISYAASIGTNEIPPQFKLIFQRYLREFDAISVREQKAKEQVEQLTDKKVDLVADPTFLLRKEDFDKLKKKPVTSGKYIYVHNVHLKRVDEALNSVAEEMSKRLNLPIIHNWSQKVFKNEAGHFTGGIEEFVGLVSEAEYVITNSFHCTVFAIIYHCNFITVPHFKHPDRMKFLLQELGIPEHLISRGEDIPKELSELDINYDLVEGKKEFMGNHAREFLTRALSTKKEKDVRNYFEYEDVFRCYGCGACKDACPVDAITMTADKEGFLYPEIDEKLCIHCDKCKRTCIYHQKTSKNKKSKEFPFVYAAYNNDKNVLKASTSGGMFTPMYRNILKKGGSVVGVCYDDNMNIVYDIADTEEGCEKFRGSKYIYADSNNVKQRVEKLLKEDKYVLYSGNPCQIAGLKSYLGKDYEKLYTVELICHGVGSPKVYRKYVDYMEELYKSKLIKFEFRNQFKGVESPFVLMEFESGSVDIELAKKNNLNRAFASNNMERPCCYTCEYAGLKNGVADFTIGDYWGIEIEHPDFTNPDGVSLLLINTEKGKKMFEEIKDAFVLKESTYEKAYKANHVKPMVMTTNRTRLMYYLDEKPIDDLLLTFNHLKKGGLKDV